MAGRGSRFADAGFQIPKPLIPVHGVPMIRLVIENVRPSQPHRFIFICQRQHVTDFLLREKLDAWAPGCEIVELDGVTGGAAETVLCARGLIDSPNPLMIVNSDQYVDVGIDAYLRSIDENALDGLIMTMYANDQKWSYVDLNDRGLVRRVVEKEVISDHATVGIYNFRRGEDFVRAADLMMSRGLRVNGEYYVAPVYDLLIETGARVGIYDIGSVGQGTYGLGTPADLEEFLVNPLSARVAGRLL